MDATKKREKRENNGEKKLSSQEQGGVAKAQRDRGDEAETRHQQKNDLG